MSTRSRVMSTAFLACCTAVVAGCDKSTSQATAPPPAMRQVAATLEDTTGARQSGVTVWAIGLDQGTEATFEHTDASGVAHFSLIDGRYCLSATKSFQTVTVAASTGRVQQQPAGHPDSVLFRLVLLPGSILRGKVTLTGRSTHDGTIVGLAEVPTFTGTAADGSYELGGVPPGTWSGLATHVGFTGKLFDVVVPFPGDTVATGPVVLVPGPIP